MKESNLYNALVLLSSQEGDNPYRDYWKDGILYYTGMGVKGDQDLDFHENKTLNEANVNVVTVYLFEGENHQDWGYRGKVILADAPFQTDEQDQRGAVRKVWKLPLMPIDFFISMAY